MKGRVIFLGITASIAFLIVMLINGALKTKQAIIEALEHGRVQIAVAAQSLPAGSVIEPLHIRLAAWPRDNLPPGAITNISEIQGMAVKQDVLENQPIVTSM